MAENKIDVATELKEAFAKASPEARQLVAAVLEIEQANKHLSAPQVRRDIEKAIVDAATGVGRA